VPQIRREPLSTRAVTTIRVFFVVLGLASMVLGYIGLGPHVHAEELTQRLGKGNDSVADLLYYDLELFLVQSTPLSVGGPPPWQLQIARFGAPSVALYALAEILVALFATRFRYRRLRRMRGHAIVCGATRAAEAVAERLRGNGMRVVMVAPDASTEAPAERGRLAADPRSPRSLLAAGADRAALLYACLDQDAENAQVASAAERLRTENGHPEKIRVLIEDLDLCTSLRARRWSLAETAEQHLDFFTPDELAAQAIVRADDAAFGADGRPPEIAVVGTGAFARSVLIELARRWSTHPGPRRGPIRALLIGPDAAACASALYGRYAFLPEVCRIEPRTEPFEEVLARHADDPATPRLRRLYLCQEDEKEALTSALDAAGLPGAAFAEVVVRLDRMAGLAGGFRPGRDGAALFDALGGRLRLVDVTATGCDPDLIEDGFAERLARACHHHYHTAQLRAGAVPGSSPALVSWEELGDEYKSANRDQAAGIGRRLATLGCLLSPRRPGDPQFAYEDDELELLAELEHERWVEERTRRGWTWGPRRDEAAKHHPDLLPWRELTEAAREKDRQAVLAGPALLADAGLAIIRTGSR